MGAYSFFADTRGPLGFDKIFFSPKDNKIYGWGSEIERGWEWAFYSLGEGKIEGGVFKPVFPQGAKFTFRLTGWIEITDAPSYYITINFPGILKKLDKEESRKPPLSEIVEEEQE